MINDTLINDIVGAFSVIVVASMSCGLIAICIAGCKAYREDY